MRKSGLPPYLNRGPHKKYRTRIKSKGRFRSKFEKDFANFLNENKVTWEYEQEKYLYYVPMLNKMMCPTCGLVKGLIQRNYTPDFTLKNGIIIECKGLFSAKDRVKMRAVLKQHQDLDVRLVFMRDNVIKDSADKITYTQWCDKYNIKSCVFPDVPEEWLLGKRKRAKLNETATV